MTKGTMRVEFRPQRRNDDHSRRRSFAFPQLPVRLFLTLCLFTSVLLSVDIIYCSAFPMKKAQSEKSKPMTERVSGITALSSPSFSLSPSCVGQLSTPSNSVRGNKKDDSPTTMVKYYVIGTSHFRCDSYKEVSALIRQKQPDGVVIELDPERLLRLTLDDATTRTAAKSNVSSNGEEMIGNRWFGGDFLSAIETAKELDIPIFLGDEYPIETRLRFTNTIFDIDSYNAKKLLTAMASFISPRSNDRINGHLQMLSVDVFGTFLEDPQKLLPLAATLCLPILAVVCTIVLDTTGTSTSSNYETLVTFLTSVISFVALCKVYNNLIADRDIVLASNAKRAATTIALLKSNQLIRKRWTFSVNECAYEGTPEQTFDEPDKPLAKNIPLFTLKNPLEQNAIRNLNLFEPRWLKMIDRLWLPETQRQDRKTESEDEIKSDFPTFASNPSSSERKIIGCVTCTNKFYSAINVAKASKNNDNSSFIEGRYADVIFRRRGRLGELINVVEGSRPSGARKVGAQILGKEAFDFPSSKDENGNDRISVVREGYLTASGLRPMNEDANIPDVNIEDAPDEINIVVVVGLLHANGVLDCLLRTHCGKDNE